MEGERWVLGSRCGCVKRVVEMVERERTSVECLVDQFWRLLGVKSA